MIRIRVKRNATGQIGGFSVKGHAAYANKGYDIVCAGVSAICQTALIGMGNYLTVPFKTLTEPGEMELVLPPLSAEEFQTAEVILNTMLWGLMSLQQGYPENIEIIDAK